MRFEFISVEKANYPVTILCHVLEVSTSGYYAWSRRAVSARHTRQRQLAVKVRAAHNRSGGRYGSPRVFRELRAQGEVVSEKTVAKLMRAERIVGRRKRRFKVTTDSRNTERIADNLLHRNFEARAPNTVWVTDVTAIWSHAGWVFLAAILDLFSRRIVGWATSEHNDTALALAALDRAITARNPNPGLIHHSDRGSPYGSDAYYAVLKARGIVPSMARKGDCWDNAVAESFFATFKAECVDGKTYADYAAVTRDAAGYIERFYNPRRLHSTLDYVSPVEYELAYALHSEAA